MRLTASLLAAQLPLGALGAAISASRSLQPWTYSPLPLGSVRPKGWLLGEMTAMANGLAGHEYDFYVYINQSSWLNEPGRGGSEYSNLNEALPYWFNGLVPMAFELDDARLKAQVTDVANTVLGHQADDGWIGPEVGAARNFWARTPFFMGLTQLAEADPSWVRPVVSALRRFMALANKMLKNDSQGFANCAGNVDCTWGQARVHDLIITIQWLLEKHPSPDQDALLWENMDLFYAQSNYKWDRWYTVERFPKVADPGDGSIWPYIHGVNVGQGLKFPSVMYRINGSGAMAQTARNAVDWSFRYHGSPSGSILADEHERGLSSFIGSELCTAVETSYSLAYMFQVHGDGSYADRAETTIFNAFPVMMTGDKWAHQYMAQPNQPFALNTTQRDGSVPPVFTTANSGVATTFGMEPLYPCCTVNHHQGYTKFTSHSWVAVAGGQGGRGGLAHALLSPSRLTTAVAGGAVTIDCDTNYPFSNVLTYTIRAERPFDLYLRVPQWADPEASTLSLSGAGFSAQSTAQPNDAAATGMIRVPVSAGATRVTYVIVTAIRTEPRPGNTVSVFHGNLLYALDVGLAQSSSLPHAYFDPRGPGIAGLPFPQLRDHYYASTRPWNVAIDPATLRYHGIAADAALPDPVFEHGAPPNFISVEGCEIAGWGLYRGVTPDVPPRERRCVGGARRTYRLIPYGAAKVHMSELPVISFG